MAKNPIPEKLKRLRALWGRDGKPLSQAKAAARIGMSREAWNGWERGDRQPTKAIAMLINFLLEKHSG